MCRSSQYIYSITKESECKSRDAKPSSTKSSENEKFSNFDQKKSVSTTAIKERHLTNAKDISSRDTISPSETKRSTFYHLNAQDISIALATFPEFFPQGLIIDQDTLARQPEDEKLKSKDGLSARKQTMQSECGGLALWYIREYGL